MTNFSAISFCSGRLFSQFIYVFKVLVMHTFNKLQLQNTVLLHAYYTTYLQKLIIFYKYISTFYISTFHVKCYTLNAGGVKEIILHLHNSI